MAQTERLPDKMLQGIRPVAVTTSSLTTFREQMLTSHVRAMAHRSISGEPLPEVDASLFEEISEDSMMLAREVVAQFGKPA